MLLVKTKLKQSKIHGFGLFADENIPKGEIVWKFSPIVDKIITKKELAKLPKLVQKEVKWYSYLSDEGYYVLCGDNARFMNHSNNPTFIEANHCSKLSFCEPDAIASRNINKGEELTGKYLYFDKKGKPHHLK
jgi:SET domain-containing protein